MNAFNRPFLALVLLAAPLVLSGCRSVGDAIRREGCRYAERYDVSCSDYGIRSLDAGTLAGVPLSGRRGAALADDAAIVAAWERGTLPLAFTITLDVTNLGDAPLAIHQLAWSLTADGAEIARGVTTDARTVAPGATASVPLRATADLRRVFNDRTLAALVEFADRIAGDQETPVAVRLAVTPTVRAASGEAVTFPTPFVVDYQTGGE